MNNYNRVFFGHVDKNGELLIDFQAINTALTKMRGDVQVVVGKRKHQRSTNQNALYWLWLGIIESETGNGTNDLHDFFKTKFLKRTKEVFGKVYEVVQSTALLDSMDFTTYMDKVRQFALHELNITLPESYPQ